MGGQRRTAPLVDRQVGIVLVAGRTAAAAGLNAGRPRSDGGGGALGRRDSNYWRRSAAMRGRLTTNVEAAVGTVVDDRRQLRPAERTVRGRHRRQHAAGDGRRRRRTGETGRLDYIARRRRRRSMSPGCGGDVVFVVARSRSQQVLGETRIVRHKRVGTVRQPVTTTLRPGRVLIVLQ